MITMTHDRKYHIWKNGKPMESPWQMIIYETDNGTLTTFDLHGAMHILLGLEKGADNEWGILLVR